MTTDIIARLAMLNDENNNSIYVVYEYLKADGKYLLVELDRPADGEVKRLNRDEFELLTPLEVVESVTEWK